ncbi:MAG: hypothetical protein GY755_21050 [Chloroflexi bacterium]|nr:hypothetical protein [Chloroflexota bacterium]
MMYMVVNILEMKKNVPYSQIGSTNEETVVVFSEKESEGTVSSEVVVNKKKWNKSPWLPKSIDNQLKYLAKLRRKFVRIWSHGGSSIDLDVVFTDAPSMVLYIPRSLQIALFSPFPNIWFSPGKKASGSAMRMVSAFEMFFVYFCLMGLPFFLWKSRNQQAMWVIVFVCTSMLIIYAMIVPNQGALYRFRYPFYTPLICLGLVGWMSRFSKTFTYENYS